MKIYESEAEDFVRASDSMNRRESIYSNAFAAEDPESRKSVDLDAVDTGVLCEVMNHEFISIQNLAAKLTHYNSVFHQHKPLEDTLRLAKDVRAKPLMTDHLIRNPPISKSDLN